MRVHLVVIAAVTAAFFTFGLSGLRGAGRDATEEDAIRKAIVAADGEGGRNLSMPDSIFWSGAFKKPVIRSSDAKAQEHSGEGSISDRISGSQIIKSEPIRIVVANSKDLAYEYSKFTMEFKSKSGKLIKFDGGVLRVWQKQDGVWKQAAMFARPYDE